MATSVVTCLPEPLEGRLLSQGHRSRKRAGLFESWVPDVSGGPWSLSDHAANYIHDLSAGVAAAYAIVRDSATDAAQQFGYIQFARPAVRAAEAVRLDEVLSALRGARWILDLGDDWDDEGAVGYRQSTLNRATLFLIELAGAAAQFFETTLPGPRISPADEGSVDLHWQLPYRQLLINIPASDEPMTFYGDSAAGDSISGVIRAGAVRPDLAAWLLDG